MNRDVPNYPAQTVNVLLVSSVIFSYMLIFGLKRSVFQWWWALIKGICTHSTCNLSYPDLTQCTVLQSLAISTISITGGPTSAPASRPLTPLPLLKASLRNVRSPPICLCTMRSLRASLFCSVRVSTPLRASFYANEAVSYSAHPCSPSLARSSRGISSIRTYSRHHRCKTRG